MGKKNRSGSGALTAHRVANQAVSLREETSGRTRVDEAPLLRVNHLQRLAEWAGAEAGVGPAGALLGRRLAESAEAAGVPLGSATFLCQRCEIVLKPGFNCTVRIKNKSNKTKRRKKSNCCQNSVAYACNFCGDQNLILGSGKGVVKSLLSSREKASLNFAPRIFSGNNSSYIRMQDMKEALEHSQAEETVEHANYQHLHETEPISSKVVQTYEANVPSKAEFLVDLKFVTPQKSKLMEVNGPKYSAEQMKTSSGSVTHAISCKSAPNYSMKNAKSASNDSAQVSGSSTKRTRKGWTTLKQMAEKDDLERKEKMGNFIIPFFMQ